MLSLDMMIATPPPPAPFKELSLFRCYHLIKSTYCHSKTNIASLNLPHSSNFSFTKRNCTNLIFLIILPRYVKKSRHEPYKSNDYRNNIFLSLMLIASLDFGFVRILWVQHTAQEIKNACECDVSNALKVDWQIDFMKYWKIRRDIKHRVRRHKESG